jgi:hypothetical protein
MGFVILGSGLLVVALILALIVGMIGFVVWVIVGSTRR